MEFSPVFVENLLLSIGIYIFHLFVICYFYEQFPIPLLSTVQINTVLSNGAPTTLTTITHHNSALDLRLTILLRNDTLNAQCFYRAKSNLEGNLFPF